MPAANRILGNLKITMKINVAVLGRSFACVPRRRLVFILVFQTHCLNTYLFHAVRCRTRVVHTHSNSEVKLPTPWRRHARQLQLISLLLTTYICSACPLGMFADLYELTCLNLRKDNQTGQNKISVNRPKGICKRIRKICTGFALFVFPLFPSVTLAATHV